MKLTSILSTNDYIPSPKSKDTSDLWNTYELLFILPPDTISRVENVKEYPTITKLIEIVEKSNGAVERIESWGKRLTYKIRSLTEGDYVMFIFKSNHKVMKKIDKFCSETKEPEIPYHMITRRKRA